MILTAAPLAWALAPRPSNIAKEMTSNFALTQSLGHRICFTFSPPCKLETRTHRRAARPRHGKTVRFAEVACGMEEKPASAI